MKLARPNDECFDLLDQLFEMGSISNGNAAGPTTNGLASLTANRGQMDINMLYQKLLELSDVLKDNREKTQGIVASAEEFAVCTEPSMGSSPLTLASGSDDQWSFQPGA